MSQPQFQKVQHIHRERMGGQGRCAYRGEYGPDSVPQCWLIVDSKSRKKLPKWLTEAVETIVLQATTWAIPHLQHLHHGVAPCGDRLGIVRYHVTNTKYESDLVVMRAGDFERFILVDYSTAPPICETPSRDNKESLSP